MSIIGLLIIKRYMSMTYIIFKMTIYIIYKIDKMTI